MNLTHTQRAILKQYQQFRERPPTVGRLFALSAAGYLVLLLALAVIAAFWLVLGQWEQVRVIAVLAIGFALREYQLNRRCARFWPVLAEVLDWKKVDELVWVEADCSPAD